MNENLHLEVDVDLLASAERLTGIADASALVQLALTALVERESARLLVRAGGSEPALRRIRRRKALP